jgi:hypothetical protein
VVLQNSMHDILTVDAEAVVVGFHEDVRPLQGGAGMLDWVLCGALSRLIKEGRIRGALGEVALTTTAGKFSADKIFLIGMGRRSDASAATLHRIARTAAESLVAAGVGRAAIDLFPLQARPDREALMTVKQGLDEGAADRPLQVVLLAQDTTALAQIADVMQT